MNENKINRIIDSAKGLEPVEPNPYLFNKILDRIKTRSESLYESHPKLVWTVIFSLVILTIFNSMIILKSDIVSESNTMNRVAESYGLSDVNEINF